MKSNLRNWAKSIRASLDMETVSSELVQELIRTSDYIQAKNIMIFYPKKGEVNLLSLLKDKTKNFYLPKIENENLLCCPYKEEDKLCLSCFNTEEPLTKACKKDVLDLIIVPALACDKDNYRLGYGGGFYDRFLKDTDAVKITCLPKELIVSTVFPEEFDIKMDKIITC